MKPHETPVPDFIVTDYLQRAEVWAALARETGGGDIRAAMQTAERYHRAVFVPITGKGVQRAGTSGFYPDGFMLQTGAFRFSAVHAIERATIAGWLPEFHRDPVEIAVSCAGQSVRSEHAPGTAFTVEFPLQVDAGSEHEFTIALSSSFQPSSFSDTPDTRHLGCIVQLIEFS